MRIQQSVQEAVDAVCPNFGIEFGRIADKTTWAIHFKDEATEDERAAAQAVLDAFDPTKETQIAAIDAQLEAIDDATRAAMRGLRDFILGVLSWAAAAKQSSPDLPDIPQNDGIAKLAALEQAASVLRAQRKAITG